MWSLIAVGIKVPGPNDYFLKKSTVYSIKYTTYTSYSVCTCGYNTDNMSNNNYEASTEEENCQKS